MCGTEPGAYVPIEHGFLRAHSMNSFRFEAGTFSLTPITSGPEGKKAMGVMSLSRLYGSLLYSTRFCHTVPEVVISKV